MEDPDASSPGRGLSWNVCASFRFAFQHKEPIGPIMFLTGYRSVVIGRT